MGEMVMWLKLTSSEDDTKILFNSDKILGFCIINGTVVLSEGGARSDVKESLEEIELMLNGVTRQPDPRARNTIGGGS